MSRHSLRAKDTPSIPAHSSSEEPSSSSTYPPKSGHSNQSSMASSRAHPYRYQHAPLYSPMALESNDLGTSRASVAQTPRHTNPSNPNGEKLHTTQNPPQRAPSRHRDPPLPLQRRPIILLLIFLPIPPLLSLLYMAVGHAILLRHHLNSPTSIYHAPIVSSIEAGATGGVVLSLPIALLLYLFLFPGRQPSVPEDFFEDDDTITTTSARWMMYAGYAACVFFFIGIGGIAGPLGVTCLSSGSSHAFIILKKLLSPGAAAAAGFVGGVVLSFSMLFLGVLTTLAWLFWRRRNQPGP